MAAPRCPRTLPRLGTHPRCRRSPAAPRRHRAAAPLAPRRAGGRRWLPGGGGAGAGSQRLGHPRARPAGGAAEPGRAVGAIAAAGLGRPRTPRAGPGRTRTLRCLRGRGSRPGGAAPPRGQTRALTTRSPSAAAGAAGGLRGRAQRRRTASPGLGPRTPAPAAAQLRGARAAAPAARRPRTGGAGRAASGTPRAGLGARQLPSPPATRREPAGASGAPKRLRRGAAWGGRAPGWDEHQLMK